MSILKATNIAKHFGDISALQNINLNIEKGEIYGLVGPDGAGKTTLIRIMIGILQPNWGKIEINNFDISKNTEEIRHTIGYMSQRFSLYHDLTVEENLEFYANLYEIFGKERQKRLKRLLEFSRLGPYLDRRAENLSGGMKQKLGLSCALIHTPQILFLDEPTTGVDPVSRRDLWMLLYDLWKEGMTIFVSTPYMDEAERCNRIGLIHEGKIIAEGSPQQMKSTAGFSVIEITVKDVLDVRAKLERYPQIRGYTIFGSKLHFISSNYAKDIGEIEQTLKKAEIIFSKTKSIEPSLEDIFLYLTSNTTHRKQEE